MDPKGPETKICPLMSRGEIVITEARPLPLGKIQTDLAPAMAPQATQVFVAVACQEDRCALWSSASMTCSVNRIADLIFNLIAGDRFAR